MNLDRLRSVVPVSVDAAERIAHARDLWPRGTLALAGAGPLPPSPEAVAWPRDGEEIAACLAWAEAEGVAIVPYGAGSGVCGAAAGRAGSLVLDLKRMNRIGLIEGDTVTCQPGVLGQHLEDALERVGRATRHSPSSIWCSTVGGWAASRSAGQFSSKYGKFEDMVLGLKVVAPAGAFGTGVWASGEDLGPWVMGAEGSLGVISELLVRTVPVPAVRKFGAWRFASVEAAWESMRALLQADLHPAVLRLYDPVDTRIAGKGSATTVKAKEGAGWLDELRTLVESVPALRSHLLSLPLALPRLLNALAQGVSSGCILIAGWEGEPDVVEVLARHGAALLSGGEPLGEELGEHWYAHRHDVSYKSAPIFERGGFADTMEVATTWSRLPALYKGVRAALGRHALVMAHFSHVYQEGCSIYFSFAGVGRLDVYDAAWRDALSAAAEAGGTVAHHHGVGQLKMAAAARELAGIAPRFHALKARLDPAGILNPGRLFPLVDMPEPAAPPVEIDPVSRIATLDAQQPAAERDDWLAKAGWELRFPSTGSLAASVGAPRQPWESRVLGASARLDGRRAVFLAVPRSSAGPDPREALPAGAYETLTVPVVRRDEAVVRVDVSASTCLAADLRPAREIAGSAEFRGPAAADLAALARRLGPIGSERASADLPAADRARSGS
ncbi:MAG: FAD-binding oxidoreductase [Pseudomonadota bacterium]|nr:FAD-binding oxidoreductase [Pseudomonadota bacterium]